MRGAPAAMPRTRDGSRPSAPWRLGRLVFDAAAAAPQGIVRPSRYLGGLPTVGPCWAATERTRSAKAAARHVGTLTRFSDHLAAAARMFWWRHSPIIPWPLFFVGEILA